METETQDSSENTLSNGSTHPPKRGRGRPPGSLNKKYKKYIEKLSARASKQVDFFSPEMVVKSKVRKRGRPKKLKIRGRPRKIPLTPEEQSEILHRQRVQRKRKLSKPLGRPRIHPIIEAPKIKRSRGRPRKYEAMAESQNDTNGAAKESPSSVDVHLDVADGSSRKRGRPLGSFKKKKRGRPSGSARVTTDKVSGGTPRKRGRPPGSGSKVKSVQGVGGTPRKRGRPPGSSNRVKIIRREADGTPRKRGRPPGSGKKFTVKKKGDAPRKRGRPPGSGKIKLCVPDEVDLDLGSFGGSCTHRKKGRPSKVRLAVVLEKLPATFMDKDESESDAPSPKQSCDSDSPAQVPNETTQEEDHGATEKKAEVSEEADNTVDCPKVNNVSEQEISDEMNSRVGSGKFKKKKDH